MEYAVCGALNYTSILAVAKECIYMQYAHGRAARARVCVCLTILYQDAVKARFAIYTSVLASASPVRFVRPNRRVAP